MFSSNALILINKTPLSHNVSYAEQLNGTPVTGSITTDYHLDDDGKIVEDPGFNTDVATVSDTTGLENTNYTDVFKLHNATEFGVTCADINCQVACSCNTDKGWSDTKPESGEYYQVTSNIHRSSASVANELGTTDPAENSASTLSTGVNGITTLSTSAEVKAMSTSISAQTLSSGSSTTPTNTQTCYKAKGNNYFINIDYCHDSPSPTKYQYKINKITTNIPGDPDIVIAMRDEYTTSDTSTEDDVVYRNSIYYLKDYGVDSSNTYYSYYEPTVDYLPCTMSEGDYVPNSRHASAIFIEDKAIECNLTEAKIDKYRTIFDKYCSDEDGYDSTNNNNIYYGKIYSTPYSHQQVCENIEDWSNLIDGQFDCAWDNALVSTAYKNINTKNKCLPYDENNIEAEELVVKKGNDTYTITYNHNSNCSSGGEDEEPDEPTPDTPTYFTLKVGYDVENCMGSAGEFGPTNPLTKYGIKISNGSKTITTMGEHTNLTPGTWTISASNIEYDFSIGGSLETVCLDKLSITGGGLNNSLDGKDICYNTTRKISVNFVAGKTYNVDLHTRCTGREGTFCWAKYGTKQCSN